MGVLGEDEGTEDGNGMIRSEGGSRTEMNKSEVVTQTLWTRDLQISSISQTRFENREYSPADSIPYLYTSLPLAPQYDSL